MPTTKKTKPKKRPAHKPSLLDEATVSATLPAIAAKLADVADERAAMLRKASADADEDRRTFDRGQMIAKGSTVSALLMALATEHTNAATSAFGQSAGYHQRMSRILSALAQDMPADARILFTAADVQYLAGLGPIELRGAR
jgi:hypothetical protein